MSNILTCERCGESGLRPDQFYGSGVFRRPECRRCTVDVATEGRYKKRTKERANEIAYRTNRTVGARYGFLKDTARRVKAEMVLTREQYAELISQPCHYCGFPLNETGHGLDRKDAGGPYSVDNCVPACFDCNMKKHRTFTYPEMLVLGQAIRAIKMARQSPRHPASFRYSNE